jgi:1-piperideine-2-carboxylate/1-pyrroline-2-carboxylate reductase [NAD(P)H]
MKLLDAQQTSAALPWPRLVDAIEQTLRDQRAGHAHVPERLVLPIGPATSWFVMPAWLAAPAGDVAMAKLITYSAHNPAQGRPAIQGDVIVLRASTGERIALLDGPTVTARRTAAVSALAARRLAPCPQGPLLVFGAGVQALAHAQAFAELLGVRELWVRSRGAASAQALVEQARRFGLRAEPAAGLAQALARCPLVVTATSAAEVCLRELPREDGFVAAVGAFKASMIELDPALVRTLAAQGEIVIDSDAARHEAGDLLQAGIDVDGPGTLADVLQQPLRQPAGGTRRVLFKSCGSALWDLAAARCAMQGA